MLNVLILGSQVLTMNLLLSNREVDHFCDEVRHVPSNSLPVGQERNLSSIPSLSPHFIGSAYINKPVCCNKHAYFNWLSSLSINDFPLAFGGNEHYCKPGVGPTILEATIQGSQCLALGLNSLFHCNHSRCPLIWLRLHHSFRCTGTILPSDFRFSSNSLFHSQ